MIKTTLGKYMVNQALPPELRDEGRVLVGDKLDELLTNIANDHPEKYREISHKLVGLGREASFSEGTTLTLDDLLSPMDRKEIFKYIDQQEKKIRKSVMPPAEKDAAIEGLYGEMQKHIADTTYKKALESGNPLALQVLSKARGNPTQLAAMLATPSTFKDAKGKTIPVFVRHSYAEGLTPVEYYAATFGAREGVKSTKFATQEAGDFGKQLNVASAGLIVTQDNCDTLNGIPVDVEDNDTIGAMLARPMGGYKHNTPVTKTMLNELKKEGFKKILVRSPVTCQTGGGVCKYCSGLREDGKLPNLRDHIGIKASSALAERIAQGALNVKHSGGQKDKGNDDYAGFPIIDQLGSIPSNFKHRASVAELDGQVSKIEPAPQGGTNITVDGEVHYVLPEHTINVKVGDKVEAGDQLSSGLLNPAEVVHHKGIGEGRRYFAERLTKAFRDSKLTANRRNAEVVARALIDHVNIDEPEGLGDYLPGDVVSYSDLAHSYRPRKDAQNKEIKTAVGQYLEQPALHYSIGTRVTRRMADELKNFGIDKVMTHEVQPSFHPEMIRLRAIPHYGKDWMGKLQGSYLQTVLLKDVQTGGKSDIHGTNPIPGIAHGVEFGKSKPGKVTY